MTARGISVVLQGGTESRPTGMVYGSGQVRLRL